MECHNTCIQEQKKNEEFERNNPEFCKEQLDDIKARSKKRAEEVESANIFRLKGNRFFKQKKITALL